MKEQVSALTGRPSNDLLLQGDVIQLAFITPYQSQDIMPVVLVAVLLYLC
jgi:hypothetical protein